MIHKQLSLILGMIWWNAAISRNLTQELALSIQKALVSFLPLGLISTVNDIFRLRNRCNAFEVGSRHNKNNMIESKVLSS